MGGKDIRMGYAASCYPSARMRSEGYGSCPVCVCVCQCVHGSNLLVVQKLVILTGSVSCSLQNEFGIFRIIALFRR